MTGRRSTTLPGFLTNLAERETDVLLIAGDVSDVTNLPPGRNVVSIVSKEANRRNPGLQIVIIAGNHDPRSVLGSPNPLPRKIPRLSVSVGGRIPGRSTSPRSSRPFKEPGGRTGALCAAVPFLRQEMQRRLRESLIRMWRGIGRMYRRSVPMRMPGGTPGEAIVAWDTSTPRSRVVGRRPGASAPSWRSGVRIRGYLTPGSLIRRWGISIRRKWIGGRQAALRGSPLPMSFSEKNYRHQVIAVAVEEGKVAVVSRRSRSQESRTCCDTGQPSATEVRSAMPCRASGAGGGQGG